MKAYVASRLAFLVLMLGGLLVITFAISHVAPGDPARLAAGPDATASMVETLRQKYGLDQPLPVQFLFVDALLRGQWATLGDALLHAILPVITLCLPALASIVRVNRAEMIEVLRQDYITNLLGDGLRDVLDPKSRGTSA